MDVCFCGGDGVRGWLIVGEVVEDDVAVEVEVEVDIVVDVELVRRCDDD
jgi:hypothetical protein